MKKVIFIIALCILPILTFSQNKFGVFAGISNSALTNGFLEGVALDKVFSPHIGGVYNYGFNETISFRPQLVLSLQGDRKEGAGGSYVFFDNTIDYKLTYLNVPLSFKFFSKPYILAGPQFGLLINTKKGAVDFGDIKNKLDYGLNCGIGYEFSNFFIEAKMYQAISSILEIEGFRGAKDKITNTVLQLSLGLYLD